MSLESGDYTALLFDGKIKRLSLGKPNLLYKGNKINMMITALFTEMGYQQNTNR